MKKNTFLILTLCLSVAQFSKMSAQVFVEGADGAQELNLCTCEVTPALPNSISSSLAASTSNLFITIDQDFFSYDFNAQTPVFVNTLPGEPVGLVYGPDNLLYANAALNAAQNDTLISIDPITGNATVLGAFPTGWWLAGDLFFYGGQLYGWFASGTTMILGQISTTDPESSTAIFTFSDWLGQIGSAVAIINGVETVLVYGVELNSGQQGIYTFDMATGAYQMLCPGIIVSDMAAAPGYGVPICCSNLAGNFATLNLQTACQNQSITLNHLGDEVLSPGSALSFVLMADSTGDLPDDILQISASPAFNFDASTMVLGQVYFVAAVAAPGSAGVPDWSAGCLDVSFFANVKWVAAPTVNFYIPNPEVCAGDCLDFEVNFTGEAPFNLTFENPISGQQQSQIFPTQNGVLQICPPSGSPAGNFNLSAVSLSDANCTCN